MAAGESDFLREMHCRFLALSRRTEVLPQIAVKAVRKCVYITLRMDLAAKLTIIIIFFPQQLEEVPVGPFSCVLATCTGAAWFQRMEAPAGGLRTGQVIQSIAQLTFRPAEAAEAEVGVG